MRFVKQSELYSLVNEINCVDICVIEIMENIEVLKRSLNTEKVFYELDWHTLDMDKSFGDSIYDKFEQLKSSDDLISNKKAKYNVNKKKNDDKNNIEKNCKSILINKEGNPIENNKKNVCKEIKWDCNYNQLFCAYNNDTNKYEHNPIPSTPLCSCIKDKSAEKKSPYEIKKCNKIPYDIQKCTNYYSHEIKKGYFLRTYYFMKPIDKENIHYEHKHGIMKVCVYLLK